MVYESKLNEAMLDVLENRMSGIADCITVLNGLGYIPNRNKYVILSLSSILVECYNNIDIFTEEQKCNLDTIYNKILKL